MKRENPYFVLQQYYIHFCKGGDRYRITLCRTDAARERLNQRARLPVPGWVPAHMTKTAEEMRDYCSRWMQREKVVDETGVVC